MKFSFDYSNIGYKDGLFSFLSKVDPFSGLLNAPSDNKTDSSYI